MWTIRGLGDKEIKLLEVCRPVLLICSVSGGRLPDEQGLHLHAVYVVDAGKVRPAAAGLGGDASDPSLRVHFDLNGPTHLNLPGTLYLTGGKAEFEYAISSYVQECHYTPSWHPLTVRAESGQYTIPSYHSRMRTAAGVVGFALGGNEGVLTHEPIACAGDTTLVILGGPATIITEWWG